MANLNAVKDELARLVKLFEAKPKKNWDEAGTRQYLIDPFWEALGWDTRDENKVKVELPERIDGSTKWADYAFIIDRETRFLVEAKQPAINLKNNKNAIYQLKKYVFNDTQKTVIGILQDFEEFVPYLVRTKPKTENYRKGILNKQVMSYEQYADRAEELLNTFGYEAAIAGSIEKLIPKTKKLETVKEPLNRAFFADLKEWRRVLASNIAKNNEEYNADDINVLVNELLNRLLFIRILEDRKTIEQPDLKLEYAMKEWKYQHSGDYLYAYVCELFEKLATRFNGSIFKKRGKDLCFRIIVDNDPLYKFIKELYPPKSSYYFGRMPVELIGNAYEKYLGEIIRLTPTRQVKLEEKPEVRKAGGVYYTPKYIVDYIVEQTVGALLEGRTTSGNTVGSRPASTATGTGDAGIAPTGKMMTPKQIENLRILDPACGSGSFLIGAFEKLLKYHFDYYLSHPRQAKDRITESPDGKKKLRIEEKRKILKNNIFGVDIDESAVDITKFSLYTKMLENEGSQWLLHEAVLPVLENNIKCGNSLIGNDIRDMDILPKDMDEKLAELARINPFDWEENFPEVFARHGVEQGAVAPCPPERRNSYLAQGATTQGATTQGATTQGATTQGATTQGATTQGATTQGATAPCSRAYHITWVTHGSRVSERMVEYKDVIRRRRENKGQQPLVQGVVMDDNMEVEITGYIAETVRDMNLRVLAYNVCRDHVHIVLVCKEDKLAEIVRRLKGRSSHFAKKSRNIPKDEEFHLWAQKYNRSFIDTEEKLCNAIQYVNNNRMKHELPVNKGLLLLVRDMLYNPSVNKGLLPLAHERAGGFDVVIGNPPYVRAEGLGEQKKYFAKKYETYAGSADLYTYFIEKSLKNLTEKGKFSFIVSNKWMRSNYGKALRAFLKEYNIEEIIDFGELPVFADAATFPMIIVVNKGLLPLADTTLYAPIKRLDFDSLENEKQRVGYTLEDSSMNPNSFTLVRADSQALLDKIKSRGVPLGDYVDGKIYYGIKTGFNKAFIIDKAKRDELIAEDPKSAEIIKPFVVGNDVRKYRINFRERYLILTKIGVDIKRYPAIFKHLSQYKDRLEKRCDKGNYWWELRTCAYYEEFEKPKIHIPAFALESRFAYDDEKLYSLAPAYIIPVDDKYLLCILNSKVVWFWLRRITPVLGDEAKRGRLIIRTVYLKQLPIRTIDFSNAEDVAKHDRMVSLVEDMLALNKRLRETGSPSTQDSIKAQIAHTDKTIDRMVYDLYGLTDEEIRIVEGE